LAEYYHTLGKYDKVIALYEKAQQARPESLKALNDLVSYSTAYSQDKSQLERTAKLLEPLLQSNNALLFDSAAWLMYRQDQYEQAKQTLLKAVALNAAVGVVNYHLGMAYLKLGDKTLAKQYLQKAVDSKTEFNGVKEAKELLKNNELN
jgi:tetratricopeptide (TPR) repeat protein